jgi:hypothetical protein
MVFLMNRCDLDQPLRLPWRENRLNPACGRRCVCDSNGRCGESRPVPFSVDCDLTVIPTDPDRRCMCA